MGGYLTPYGEILLNIETIQKIFKQSALVPYAMSGTLIHEYFHALAEGQKWIWREANRTNPLLFWRRSGLFTVNVRKGQAGLAGLNEAVTEELTRLAFDRLLMRTWPGLAPDERAKVVNQISVYPEERKVLALLNQKVPFELFARAYFERGGFLKLARAFEAQFGRRALSQVNDLMAAEQDIGAGYQKTQAFIGTRLC